MAHHQLGNQQESRNCLDKAHQGMTQFRTSATRRNQVEATLGTERATVPVTEWAALHVLEREADSLVKTERSAAGEPSRRIEETIEDESPTNTSARTD
jgi:hypothetical protein